MISIDRLHQHLQSLGPGILHGDSKTVVEKLLCSAWDDLTISDEMGMQGYKVFNRTEELDWAHPYLSFNIERHGAVVMGSINAEVQSWIVDVEEGTAQCSCLRKRKLYNSQKSIRTGAIAAELAEAMVNNKIDDRIRWSRSGRAQVVLVKIFPSACQQTTNGRMKRLKHDLTAILEPLGWIHTENGWWTPPDLLEM